MREETVLVVHQSPRVLLGMKKKKLGAGRCNGIGGGKEDCDASMLECAIRETSEEIGIRPRDAMLMGKIHFQFDSDEQDHIVYFFRATEYGGEPVETAEMAPEWFNESAIPYDQMWADDKYWMPLLLRGQKFSGKFYFNADHTIRDHEINEVEEVE